jgi:hypothetical protein
MTTDDKRGGKPDPRAERLAAALRANLKRRKEQQRARAADESPAPAPPSEPGPDRR